MFLTAFYGVLHRPSGTLRYVLAGHEHPLSLRPGHEVTWLPGKGRFLGMLDPLHLDEYVVTLQNGDRLLLFSDGVTDAMNGSDQPFGHDRLSRTIMENRDRWGEDLLQVISAEVDAWAGEAATYDDLTMLLVETNPTGPIMTV